MEMIVTRLKPMVSCYDISRNHYNVQLRCAWFRVIFVHLLSFKKK